MIQMFDRLPLEGVRETDDGYLVANVKVARTGIQEYAGYEVDPDNKHGLRDRATVKVYRPLSEVFDDVTLRSFAHRPVTNDHPPVLVDASNWKQYAVGQTGDEVDARDGKFVKVPMCLMDAGAIQDYKDGKKELSMGYQTALDYKAGVTADGEAYDVSQTSMRMNHLAVVRRARGGSELRIGDHQQGEPKVDLKTITLDGLPVTTTDAGIAAIEKLKGLLSTQDAAHQTTIAARDATITELNQKLATADAALAAANGKVLDDAAIDARVATRSQLLADAAALAPALDTKALTDAAIRKAVVVAALGDAAVAGKPDSYVDARFDILVEDAKKSGKLEKVLGDTATAPGIATDAAAAEAAHTASVQDLNAWRKAG